MPTTLNAEQSGFNKTLTDGVKGNYPTLQDLGEQKICRQLGITETKQVTVSSADFVLIDSSMISGKLAIGTATTSIDGGIACAQLAGAVGTAATTTITDTEGRIWNDVNIISGATHDLILTPSGDKIFALMHCASTALDGDAIGAPLSENTQLSFVYFDSAGIIQTTTVNETIQFDCARVDAKLNQPALIREGGVSRIDVTTGSDAHYTQGFTTQVFVVVPHNLGKKPAVHIENGSGQEIYGTIIHNSINQCTITFGLLSSGTIFCN